MRRVEGERVLLVLTRRSQVPAGQAHLARQEVDIRLVRGQGPGAARRSGGDLQAVGGQRGLGHADVRLPVTRREPGRLLRRAQRVGVPAQVHQRVAGQAVRPLVRGIQGRGAVGYLDRVGVAL
ncbi:MAG TPA: hypothetical protein VIX15_19235, partial [Streptosporangiaceae bacterium]